MKQKIWKRLISCALLIGILAAFCVPGLAVDLRPGDFVFNGAGADGSQEIRVPKGGTAHVVYTASYEAPTGKTLTGLSSAWCYIKYDATKMTYNEDASAETEAGPMALMRNNIEIKETGPYSVYKGQIRTVMAAINHKEFRILIDLTNVQGTDTLQLSYIECLGKTADPLDQPEFNCVPGTAPTIIAQQPVQVTIAGATADNSVSMNATAYNAGQLTFSPTGTATALASGSTIYVDTGDGQNNRPSFTVAETSDSALAELKVDGTDVLAQCSKSGATYTLPSALDAASQVEFVFSNSGHPVENTYTVTFNANGHGAVPRAQQVKEGQNATNPGTLSADGFTFRGWFTDAAATQAYAFTTPVTGDLTLYAGWSAEGETPVEEHEAYINGYTDGTVRPMAQITRAEVATIFYRLMDESERNANSSEINDFTDVSSADWFNTAVSTLTKMGTITGYPDGTFRPRAPITRAEFAALAARYVEAPPATTNPFADISGHWAEDYIKRAAAAGLVQGDKGMFRPTDSITRAEAVTIVNRMFDREPEWSDDLLPGMTTWPDNPSNTWYYLAIQEATNGHTYRMKADDIHETWVSLIA